MPDDPRPALIELSHSLGRPERRCAILGEGNTSAGAGAATFWVKASGSRLADLSSDDLLEVDRAACRAMLDGPDLDDQQIVKALADACVDPEATKRPSVETAMHAALLDLSGVECVGHTHPVAINGIACSEYFGLLTNRLFPDQIVVCGVSAVLIPYVDPGLPLARAVRDGAADYLERYGQPPKTIFLQNHGFIAVGQSAAEVDRITAMAVKSAEILAGALAIGEPTWMSDEQVARIAGRDDEAYRQRVLAGLGIG
ncbi:MAG: class II aldolase/adducin family protein [Planctomycetota bacterium]